MEFDLFPSEQEATAPQQQLAPNEPFFKREIEFCKHRCGSRYFEVEKLQDADNSFDGIFFFLKNLRATPIFIQEILVKASFANYNKHMVAFVSEQVDVMKKRFATSDTLPRTTDTSLWKSLNVEKRVLADEENKNAHKVSASETLLSLEIPSWYTLQPHSEIAVLICGKLKYKDPRKNTAQVVSRSSDMEASTGIAIRGVDYTEPKLYYKYRWPVVRFRYAVGAESMFTKCFQSKKMTKSDLLVVISEA